MHLSYEVIAALFVFLVVVLLVLKRQVEVTNKNSITIDIESTKYLGNKHKIAVIRADNKRVLVGITQSNISPICELSSVVYTTKNQSVKDGSVTNWRDAI